MAKSAEVERWFTNTRPPSEDAMRRVRDILLGADRSMRERTQYGTVTFFSTKSGDLAAFVQYKKPGVNLMFMRGGRLQGHYPNLEGPTVKRMRMADVAAANGMKVHRVRPELAHAVTAAQVREALDEHPDVRAVCVVHHETSVGVLCSSAPCTGVVAATRGVTERVVSLPSAAPLDVIVPAVVTTG